MVDKRLVSALCIVAALGLLSVAASFIGEITRTKIIPPSDQPNDKCLTPVMPDYLLGLMAGIGLILAMLILRVETGQPFWSCGPPRLPCNIWIAITSWLFSTFGGLLASIIVAQTYGCGIVSPGVFAATGLLSLGAISCGMAYYICVVAAAPVVEHAA